MTIPAKVVLMRWGERLLALLLLALLCCIVRNMQRPAEEQPAAEEPSQPTPLAQLLPAEAPASDLRLPFLWKLSSPLPYACVLGAGDTPLHELTSAEIPVELHVRDNELYAVFGAAAEPAACQARQVRAFERRQPGGERHTLRHILLIATVTTDQEEVHFLQQLELDLTAGTADPVPCDIPQEYAALSARRFQSLAPSDLPEKCSGSPIQRDMKRLVYAIAAIDSPAHAQAAAGELLSFAGILARKAPDPGSAWPHNWEDYADDARSAAAMLTPTLVYLQENNCFESADLAAFINSPIFGLIFGHRFTQNAQEPLQQEPIDYVSTNE